jgi:hypothetical protein
MQDEHERVGEASLLMLEKAAKAAACSCLQDSQSGVAKILGQRSLGGGQASVEMGLD